MIAVRNGFSKLAKKSSAGCRKHGRDQLDEMSHRKKAPLDIHNKPPILSQLINFQ